MPLTPIQADCLRRSGNCDGCLHNIWGPECPCKVKYSAGVADKLGLQVIKPLRSKSAKASARPATCKTCGAEFMSLGARHCPACSKHPELPPKPCDVCKRDFVPKSNFAQFCEDCRYAAYEREREQTCPCGVVYTGRRKVKKCPECRQREKEERRAARRKARS